MVVVVVVVVVIAVVIVIVIVVVVKSSKSIGKILITVMALENISSSSYFAGGGKYEGTRRRGGMQAWFAKWIRHTDLGGKHAARKLRIEESERRPSSPQVQTQKREVRAKEVKTK